jgi:uncharacterized membrane protein
VYYAITPYVLILTVSTISVLLISSFYLFSFARKLESGQAPLYIVTAVMVATSAFTGLEVILHLEIQKHPVSGAILASFAFYVIAASILLAQLKLKLLACITYLTCGSVLFFLSCLPTIIWLGCATGPTCV